MTVALTAVLEARRAAVAFPGRFRVYSDLAVPVADDERAGAGIPGDQLLAAACGAALAEAPVAGRVLAVIGRERLQRGATLAALATAARLGLGNLALAVADAGPADVVQIAGSGWRIDPALGEGDGPVAAAIAPLGAAPAAAPGRAPAPVRLATLPRWRAGLAPSAGPAAFAACERWLAGLAAGEPRLVLPHRDLPLAADAAGLAVAAELAASGRRVAWLLPRGTDLVALLPALRQAARRRIALKLIAAADDLPPLASWSGAPGWWVMAPAGDGESVACLAQALASEDAALVALPTGAAAAGDWPPERDHEAGAGRWLARDDAARLTIACDARGADLAAAARPLLATAGLVADLLQCTSLAPLPVADLRDAAARGPVLALEAVADGGLADALVAAAPRSAKIAALRAESGHPLTPSDIAQAARRAAG